MGQQDLKVHELVAKIERGEIRLPEMQRQYVWRSTRVRDLFDSLYRGYPSGTILTWETDESVKTRDFAVEQGKDGKSFQLLLDGQQRLTSLSAILRGEPVHVRGRVRPIDILFNLEHPDALEVVTEVNENGDANGEYTDGEDEDAADASGDELQKRFNRMTFVVSNKKLEAIAHWISVIEVFREENSDTPFLQAAGVKLMDDPRYDKYSLRLRQLRAIRDYTYRVHILDRDKSYEEVTEIFVRVNSLGAKLRSSDLALAQITLTWRNSLKIFQEFEESCKVQGFDLSLGIHLRNLVSFATGHSQFRTVSGLSKERLQNGWKNAKLGMHFALNFLRSNAGIDSPALLSSPFIIISIASYGHYKGYKLTPEEARSLRHWVLVASTKGRYSRGSTETLLDQDLGAIRNGADISVLLRLLRNQVGRLDVQPDDLENRGTQSAYFKTMFLAFRQEEATDWQSQLVISLKHSGTQHSLQFHHIFPRGVLKKLSLSTAKVNDICNLSFIGGRTNRKISDKEPANYLPDIVRKQGKEVLTKQCIPTDPSLWQVKEYDNFLAQRRKLVANRLNEFLGHDAI